MIMYNFAKVHFFALIHISNVPDNYIIHNNNNTKIQNASLEQYNHNNDI